MQELPDIVLPDEPVVTSARAGSERSRTARAGLWLPVFVAVIVSTIIALGIALAGRDTLLSFFVPMTAKPDPYQPRFDAIRADIDALKVELVAVQSLLNNQQSIAHDEAFEQDKLAQRVTVIERFATDLEQKIKKHQAAQAQQATQKKVVVKAPKPAPVIPPVLVSIRNVAGVSYVALRDGLDSSNLLMPGDSWRGWTLIEADPARKVATFSFQGATRELSL